MNPEVREESVISLEEDNSNQFLTFMLAVKNTVLISCVYRKLKAGKIQPRFQIHLNIFRA